MTAHRAHVGPPTLTQDAICSGTPADRVEKNCSVQRSWAIQHPSQRLLSGPKSFSHNQDPKQPKLPACTPCGGNRVS
jgi:hypothetical protein